MLFTATNFTLKRLRILNNAKKKVNLKIKDFKKYNQSRKFVAIKKIKQNKLKHSWLSVTQNLKTWFKITDYIIYVLRNFALKLKIVPRIVGKPNKASKLKVLKSCIVKYIPKTSLFLQLKRI